VILEQDSIGATIFARHAEQWSTSTISDSDLLRMPESGIEFGLQELYASGTHAEATTMRTEQTIGRTPLRRLLSLVCRWHETWHPGPRFKPEIEHADCKNLTPPTNGDEHKYRQYHYCSAGIPRSSGFIRVHLRVHSTRGDSTS